ncbi:DinB family protein [Rhodopirellula sp. MGV]|uniref:DinB family protein n=1 Tax=Rhodopirellula sp. MGV TaxID=2023130 RepID=UPI000B95EB87|nr:DinB family protein [Rhodopirellula sp. MGV]OYP38848.1 hypothetical protein CGZ80_01110 [Rhodopirellula sp. MGV]PNY37656.1 DinB family protein [Rhodopirellula baltica]
MSTLAYIRHGLEVSRAMTLALIDDLKDAPMQSPTSKGGNPPLWILGHLAFGEASIVEFVIQGNDNPLAHWKDAFGARQEPSTDLADYPSWDEVRAKSDEVRANTLKFLEGLTDADLETPSKNCPEGREQVMGTIGACCQILTMHPMMHYGQLADSRRMLGREPLQA